MPQLAGSNFSDIYQDFRIVRVVFSRAIHWSLVKTKIEVLHSIYSFLQQTSYFGKNTKQCFKMKFFSFFLGSPKFYLDGSRVCVCDPCPKICTTSPDGICLVNLAHKSSYCRNIYIVLKKWPIFRTSYQ